ncbi:hypothetical protein, partial [Verrucomicrobium sp. BvORR106]|uniref:hypothetical protein n=1 Tax=Verrucomicrobium sp. BvORR106 TaxID=1403819 RepID=UPI000570082D
MNLMPLVFWAGCIAPLLGAPDSGLVKLLAVDGPLGRDAKVCLEKFIEPKMVIPMTFLAPAGARPDLRANVYLDGGEFGALLLENLPFQLTKQPGHPALLEGDFSFSLPEDVKGGRIRLVIRSGQPGSPVDPGEVRVQLVDRNKVRKSLQAHDQAQRSLAVFGRVSGLREMLKEWRIPFEDLGLDLPERVSKGVLAVGDGEGVFRMPEIHEKAALILVRNSQDEPEGIKEIKSENHVTILANRRQAWEWRQEPVLQKLI